MKQMKLDPIISCRRVKSYLKSLIPPRGIVAIAPRASVTLPTPTRVSPRLGLGWPWDPETKPANYSGEGSSQANPGAIQVRGWDSSMQRMFCNTKRVPGLSTEEFYITMMPNNITLKAEKEKKAKKSGRISVARAHAYAVFFFAFS